MPKKTQIGEGSTPPKIEPKEQTEQAVVTWKHGATIDALPDGVKIQTIGETYETGKLDANGNKVVQKRKSFRIDVPAKPDGLSGDAALTRATEIGLAVKPSVMGRVSAFASHGAVIVRRYSETPGKRDKMSLTLERIQVESTIEKLAREYKLSVADVCKRLNIPVPGTTIEV